MALHFELGSYLYAAITYTINDFTRKHKTKPCGHNFFFYLDLGMCTV